MKAKNLAKIQEDNLNPNFILQNLIQNTLPMVCYKVSFQKYAITLDLPNTVY